MKVIFLDVDGVLNDGLSGDLDSLCLQILARTVIESGCKVVVSSNWRLHNDLLLKLHQTLYGMGIDCIGATPDAGEGQHGIPMRAMECKGALLESSRSMRAHTFMPHVDLMRRAPRSLDRRVEQKLQDSQSTRGD